jgi:hypothetical protein
MQIRCGGVGVIIPKIPRLTLSDKSAC